MNEWYGVDPCWYLPLERDAKRTMGDRITTEVTVVDQLTYRVAGLEVVGDSTDHDVTIRFHRHPPYDTVGLPPEDSPRVTSSPRLESPHRFGDDALCLWQPHDPPARRWTASLGLLTLVELVRRHLFLELHWRKTGGRRRGVWLLEDAPHGLGATA